MADLRGLKGHEHEPLMELATGGYLDVSDNHLGRGMALLHFYDRVIHGVIGVKTRLRRNPYRAAY